MFEITIIVSLRVRVPVGVTISLTIRVIVIVRVWVRIRVRVWVSVRVLVRGGVQVRVRVRVCFCLCLCRRRTFFGSHTSSWSERCHIVHVINLSHVPFWSNLLSSFLVVILWVIICRLGLRDVLLYMWYIYHLILCAFPVLPTMSISCRYSLDLVLPLGLSDLIFYMW